jgi:hypothetical protein
MHIPFFIQRFLHIPLIRRLIGAACGAFVALMAYSAYQFTMEKVQAYLPAHQAAIEKPYQNAEKFRQIGEMVKQKMTKNSKY